MHRTEMSSTSTVQGRFFQGTISFCAQLASLLVTEYMTWRMNCTVTRLVGHQTTDDSRNSDVAHDVEDEHAWTRSS
jgi:hypothetical protein